MPKRISDDTRIWEDEVQLSVVDLDYWIKKDKNTRSILEDFEPGKNSTLRIKRLNGGQGIFSYYHDTVKGISIFINQPPQIIMEPIVKKIKNEICLALEKVWEEKVDPSALKLVQYIYYQGAHMLNKENSQVWEDYMSNVEYEDGRTCSDIFFAPNQSIEVGLCPICLHYKFATPSWMKRAGVNLDDFRSGDNRYNVMGACEFCNCQRVNELKFFIYDKEEREKLKKNRVPETKQPDIKEKYIDLTKILLELPNDSAKELPIITETPVFEPLNEIKIEIGTAEKVAERLMELNNKTPDMPSEYINQGIRLFKKEMMDQIASDDQLIEFFSNNQQLLKNNPIARKAFISNLIQNKGASDKKLREEMDQPLNDLIDRPLKPIEKMMNPKSLKKMADKRDKFEKQKEKDLERIKQEMDKVCRELIEARKTHKEAFEVMSSYMSFLTFPDAISNLNDSILESIIKAPSAFKDAIENLKMSSDAMNLLFADQRVHQLTNRLYDLRNKMTLVEEGIQFNPAL